MTKFMLIIIQHEHPDPVTLGRLDQIHLAEELIAKTSAQSSLERSIGQDDGLPVQVAEQALSVCQLTAERQRIIQGDVPHVDGLAQPLLLRVSKLPTRRWSCRDW